MGDRGTSRSRAAERGDTGGIAGDAGVNGRISFMGANFVARQLDYRMTRGWGQGEKAASEYFCPIATFPERFAELLGDVRRLGFWAMDLWTGHLSPAWATEDHLRAARELLDEHGLSVPSLAGWFGSSGEEFEASCKIAAALGVPVLGGSTSMLDKDRQQVVERLKHHGLCLGLENHPEKTPRELLAKIGDGGDGTIGATVDTGWFATQGYDAATALNELGDRLVHVHLKDVLAVGAHDTCRFSAGVVPLESCVRTLQRLGYRGALSVEHEPESFDPSDDSRASRELLEGWLAGSA
ncbi:MAG: sugar phosphate isomerase/epimerase [Trueperaceae bacterium]